MITIEGGTDSAASLNGKFSFIAIWSKSSMRSMWIERPPLSSKIPFDISASSCLQERKVMLLPFFKEGLQNKFKRDLWYFDHPIRLKSRYFEIANIGFKDKK